MKYDLGKEVIVLQELEKNFKKLSYTWIRQSKCCEHHISVLGGCAHPKNRSCSLVSCTWKDCPLKRMRHLKRPTVGCRCLILKGESWKEYVGQECILTERSSSNGYAFIPLEKYPDLVMDGTFCYGGCAWIDEKQLKVLDTDFDRNMTFMDWVRDNEENFCYECYTWLGDKDICPKCGYER